MLSKPNYTRFNLMTRLRKLIPMRIRLPETTIIELKFQGRRKLGHESATLELSGEGDKM